MGEVREDMNKNVKEVNSPSNNGPDPEIKITAPAPVKPESPKKQELEVTINAPLKTKEIEVTTP